MPMTQTEIDTFNASLTEALPRLRVYALSLTRDRDRAENLVQQTSLKALAGRELFRPGTNFGGWIFRIERNEFISELRRERPTVEIGDADVMLSTQPAQEQWPGHARLHDGLSSIVARFTAGSPVLEARGSLLRANREPCRNCGGHREKPHLARSYSARAAALGQG